MLLPSSLDDASTVLPGDASMVLHAGGGSGGRSGGRIGGRPDGSGGLIGRALNSESLIDSITPPFMIANGVYEKSFQVDLDRLKTGRPGLKVVNMQGGHAVNIEAADEFSATMIQFFLNP